MEAKALENGDVISHPPGSLRWNAQKLLMLGEPVSVKEVADRLDGKVPQAVVGDNDEDPVNVLHRIERVIVDSPNQDSEGVPPAA